MKVVIVNTFDTYEERVDLVREFFKSKDYEVTVIQSNFRHFKKEYREDKKEDYVFIESKSYYKNISVGRLISHYKFARDSFAEVNDIEPDILYTFVPPNSLASFAGRYKKNNKKVKLIYDIIDLWPETMPIKKYKKFTPFIKWGAMRDNNLKYADFIITECNLYQDALQKSLVDSKYKTIYLAKNNIEVIKNPEISEDHIHLAYLGSINNIIDIIQIKKIIKIFKEIKQVTVHIVGDGENRERLIDSVKSSGANVMYYGKIYDPQEKQKIFDKCHFGLNIMKETVCVGLTMKSIDYFQHGLPIINNIPADTSNIVKKYGIGINMTDDEALKKKIRKIEWSEAFFLTMKEKTYDVYTEMFSAESFFEEMETMYEEIMN